MVVVPAAALAELQRLFHRFVHLLEKTNPNDAAEDIEVYGKLKEVVEVLCKVMQRCSSSGSGCTLFDKRSRS